MSPTWLLLFFFSCLFFLTEEKMTPGPEVKKVRHRNKTWKIKTTNNEEGGEHGVEYQDDDIEPICASDRQGSVGLAIDTTA